MHTLNLNRTHDALKAGDIDSQDDPWDDVELLRLYEFQKYGSLTNHSWSGYNMLANLKRWLTGTFHGARKQHLKRYLDEFTLRWNRRRHTRTAFDNLLGLSTRLPHASLRDFVDQRV